MVPRNSVRYEEGKEGMQKAAARKAAPARRGGKKGPLKKKLHDVKVTAQVGTVCGKDRGDAGGNVLLV